MDVIVKWCQESRGRGRSGGHGARTFRRVKQNNSSAEYEKIRYSSFILAPQFTALLRKEQFQPHPNPTIFHNNPSFRASICQKEANIVVVGVAAEVCTYIFPFPLSALPMFTFLDLRSDLNQLLIIILVGDHRGEHRGGRGGGHNAGRGSYGGGGGDREKPKKENILDLGKYMDKKICVKFTGGREGFYYFPLWLVSGFPMLKFASLIFADFLKAIG